MTLNTPTSCDAIVVGGGHNGLATAALLAKAGLRTVLLERRPTFGGQVETRLLPDGRGAPGTFHTVGRLRPALVRELDLKSHGLLLVSPTVRVFAPQRQGPAVTLWGDNARTVADLARISAADARAWAAFDEQVRTFASFLGALATSTPPDTRTPAFGDALTGLLLGRAFRRLSADDARQFLRVLPMAIADHVADWFESEAIRATVAARGVLFTAMGVLSMGTTAVLLGDSAGNDGGAAGQTVFARGGPGAVSDALVLAARKFGAELRSGAEVVAVTTADGKTGRAAKPRLTLATRPGDRRLPTRQRRFGPSSIGGSRSSSVRLGSRPDATIGARSSSPEARATPVAWPSAVMTATTSAPDRSSAPNLRAASTSASETAPEPPRAKTV